MFQKVFLFNGIGSSYEKLLAKLPPELNDKYSYYYEIACARLGLNKDIEKNLGYDSKIAQWLVPFICDRVIYEHFIGKGITPDIEVERSYEDINAMRDPQLDKAKEL